MKNISEKIKTYVLYSITFFSFFLFFFENCAVYETMWKNIVERDWLQMTIWRMRVSCWLPRATNTHTGCVILIAFPLQQWLHEVVSMLRYTYIACLITSLSSFIIFFFLFITVFLRTGSLYLQRFVTTAVELNGALWFVLRWTRLSPTVSC